VPFAKPLQERYLPAAFMREDYPALVAAGEEGLQTVAVGSVLIAYNWPKGSEPYRRLDDFVGRFFSRLSDLQKPPRHLKWREANLAAVLPGWTRFAPAEEWLRHNRQVSVARGRFEEFLMSRDGQTAAFDTPEARERLFSDFVRWSQTRDRR